MDYIQIKDDAFVDGCTAMINPVNGQLVSLVKGEQEYMHAGGRFENDPQRNAEGWGNTELIMFPIVSASKNNTVLYEGQEYDLSQHGIVRAMNPMVGRPTDVSRIASATYEYEANTKIDNFARHLKDPKNPTEMSLPFDFRLQKTHTISDRLLTEFRLETKSGKPFTYALGWHPAFNTLGDPSEGFFFDMNGNRLVCLDGVMDWTEDEGGLELPYDSVRYVNEGTGRGFELRSNLGSLMLWSPVNTMFCIEPITEKKKKGTLIDLSPKGTYKSVIAPGEQKEYAVEIKPI